MTINVLTGESRRGVVGQPLRHNIVVQIMDGANPIPKAVVTFKTKDPDTFDFDGGDPFAATETNRKGIAEASVTPLRAGKYVVLVECGGEKEEIEVTAEDTGVTQLGGGAAVVQAGDEVIVVQSPPMPAPAPATRRHITVVNLGRR